MATSGVLARTVTFEPMHVGDAAGGDAEAAAARLVGIRLRSHWQHGAVVPERQRGNDHR